MQCSAVQIVSVSTALERELGQIGLDVSQPQASLHESRECATAPTHDHPGSEESVLWSGSLHHGVANLSPYGSSNYDDIRRYVSLP